MAGIEVERASGIYVGTREESEELAWQLVDQIKTSGRKYDQVLGVATGGVLPAFTIAKALDIKDFQTIRASSYVIDEKGDGIKEIALDEVLIMPLPHLNHPEGEGALIADDLIDTGNTLRTIKGLLPKADIAVVYSKLSERPTMEIATYCSKIILPELLEDTDDPNKKAWIDFWYDIEKRRRYGTTTK